MKTGDLYKNCRLCPRDCGVDRMVSRGFCGEGAGLRLAFAGLHRGEEPPLSGGGGSGTIFVSGCNLRCALCQNWQISGGLPLLPTTLGRAVSTEEFAEICLALQNIGAENVNIVTGSHAIPAIAAGLTAAKVAGLRLPVVWNSSGYENPETLDLLDGIVDIWLPDLKTLDTTLADRLFNAPNYPEVAVSAILSMLRAGQGKVIIRHLILPGYLDSTRDVLRWFAGNAAGQGALLSLMSQYTPVVGVRGQGLGIRGCCSNDDTASGLHSDTSNQEPYPLAPTPYPLNSPLPPTRFLSKHEYNTVLGWLGEFNIEDGFCQDYVTGSDWLPDFTRANPFSSGLSVPVWHFKVESRNEK